MARYIIRIQMEYATHQDYEKLNNEMKKESSRITSKYQLQRKEQKDFTLENDCEGNISLLEITASAFHAAQKTAKTYSFTVIRYKTISDYHKRNNN
jgi:hypothetical protein